MTIQITMKQEAELEKLLATKTDSEIVASFVREDFPVASTLYDLTLDQLIEALYVDYTVKKEPKLEREVGDVYERKEFEYTVFAKVPHVTREGVYVYLVAQRRFGVEEVEYIVEEY